MYIKSIAIGATNPSESKDCTVRALANATGISYEAAHKSLEMHGRLSCRGCHPHVWHEAYQAAGMSFVGIYGETLTTKSFAYRYKVKAFKGISLGSLLPTLGLGRFIVVITGHALAVIDGAIVDKGVNSSRKSVVAVYKRKESFLQLGYKAHSMLN